VSVAGALDVWSAEQFGRILDVTPRDEPLVLDLEQTEFVDHRALLALSAAASTERPVRIRRARPIIRRMSALLGIDTPNLCFE
jgi:anti-anti-sigma regulatory factor